MHETCSKWRLVFMKSHSTWQHIHFNRVARSADWRWKSFWLPGHEGRGSISQSEHCTNGDMMSHWEQKSYCWFNSVMKRWKSMTCWLDDYNGRTSNEPHLDQRSSFYFFLSCTLHFKCSFFHSFFVASTIPASLDWQEALLTWSLRWFGAAPAQLHHSAEF